MKTVLAYGDSNTWGYVPGSKPSQRYGWGIRWTSIVEKSLDGVRIIEEGLCGRTTVFEDRLRPGRNGRAALPAILESKSPLDAAVIMLGTNDCKPVYGASAHIIGKGMEKCLDEMEKYLAPEKILLVSPVFLGENVWRSDKDPEFGRQSSEISRELPEVYRNIAARRNNVFLAASDYSAVNRADEEHMDGNGHRAFAAAVTEKLKSML